MLSSAFFSLIFLHQYHSFMSHSALYSCLISFRNGLGPIFFVTEPCNYTCKNRDIYSMWFWDQWLHLQVWVSTYGYTFFLYIPVWLYLYTEELRWAVDKPGAPRVMGYSTTAGHPSWDNVIMGNGGGWGLETAGSFVFCQRKFSTTSIMSAEAKPWALRLSGLITVFSRVPSVFLLSPTLCNSLLSSFVLILFLPHFLPAQFYLDLTVIFPPLLLWIYLLLLKSVLPDFCSGVYRTNE